MKYNNKYYRKFLSKREIMSPGRYLKLSETDKKDIEEIEFIPPVLGSVSSNNFGYFIINYKRSRPNYLHLLKNSYGK